MRKVPRKNIANKFTDVVSPSSQGDYGQQEAHAFIAPEKQSERFAQFAPVAGAVPNIARNSSFSFTRFALLFVIVGVGILGIAGYRANQVRQDMVERTLSEADTLNRLIALREKADASDASGVSGTLFPEQGDGSQDYGGASISSIFSSLKDAGSSYRDFQLMTSGAIGLYAEATRFAHDAPTILLTDTGEGLLPTAKRVQTLLGQVVDASVRLQSKRKNALSALFPIPDDSYLSFQVEANRAKTFIDGLVSGMGVKGERHIAILLENPAELRPGGGFLGGYIDVALAQGKITRMEVHDINDADRLFDPMIVPPKQLQMIVRGWRAADANWFFDFPTSANKIITFLEHSRLYKDEGITFDGAIGVSGRAFGDVLGVIGNVKLKDGTVLTADNALIKIQASVQEGQANDATYPKEVLKELADVILGKMQKLTDGERSKFFELAKSWVAKRAVRVYAKDSASQSFLDQYGLTGSAFRIPQGFMGDYLAIDRANVGGGKSDLYIEEQIALESQILEEGKAQNRLTITRTHTAPKSAPWWYREVNQSYLRIHTGAFAGLTYASGITAKKITPKVDYANSGYERDSDINRLESTEAPNITYPTVSSFKEGSKNIFAGWSRVAPGTSGQAVFAYTSGLPMAPKDGGSYQFVFDKQSGTTGKYHFEIHAPVGFVFAETDTPVYEYDALDPPGRVVINLTFSKLHE